MKRDFFENRFGGAQDMLVTGFDALAIMQAGGWKTLHIVLRYVEQANTERLHQERWARLQTLPAWRQRNEVTLTASGAKRPFAAE